MLLRKREDLWKLHKNFHAHNEAFYIGRIAEPRFRKLNEDISLNSIILDAGCNTGWIGEIFIKTKHCRVYGVDVSPECIRRANMVGVIATLCPVEKLPYPDNLFDICMANEILEHLFCPEDGIKELYRVLRIGGKLIGTVPRPLSKHSHASKYQHIYHYHDFNEKNLRQVLETSFPSNSIFIERCPMRNDDRYGLYFRAVK